jgi:hypothetical protein
VPKQETAPPPGNAAFTNEPAGFVTLSDQAWGPGSLAPGEAQHVGGWYRYGTDNTPWRLVDDPSAPLSPPSVLRHRYKVGLQGGDGYPPIELPINVAELFFGFWVRIGPVPFQYPDSNHLKYLYVLQEDAQERRNALTLIAEGGRNQPLQAHHEVAQDYIPSGGWYRHGVGMTDGEWQKVECYVKKSSARGVADGILRLWINGVQALNVTSAHFSDANWSQFHMDPVWGGSGGVLQQEQYMYFDHIYLSGRSSEGGSASIEPSGMTLATDRNFNTIAQSVGDGRSQGWGEEEAYSYGSGFALIDDATAPISPSKVLRMHFPRTNHNVPYVVPTGTSYSPGMAWTPLPGGKKTLYTRFAFRLSSNFEFNQSGNQKFILILTDGNPGGRLLFSFKGTGSTAKIDLILNDSIDGGRHVVLANNLSNPTVSRGVWHTVELLAVMNTSGQGNGALTVRMDGADIAQHTNVKYGAGSDSWMQYDIDPVWGGGEGTIQARHTLDVDHVYVSVK